MRKLFSLLAAVLFAGSMMAAVKEYTVTIGQSNFPGNSYAANNGVHKSTAVAADESTMEVEWTSNQVMWSSNKIQGQKNTGYIYNAASWGTVKSITINDNENFAFLIGSEAQPTATAEGGFFKISAGSATSKASSIVIVFDADASVPVLKANDVVLGTVIFEGESGSKLDSVAITAANLTEDIAVSTTSAKITLGATSVDKAGGVLKFTVNSGEGEINDTITLTSGELVAKVAVTGHFYAKVKNPGIAATFEAGPENSQGGDSTFVNGDKAVKAGTSSNAGSAVISLPANAVKLHFMAAAWNGKPCTMTLSTEDATLDVDSINLIADAGIANTSPFFTAEGDLTKYQHTVNISGADDDITIVATTKGTNKRFVIWDVTYEMSEEPQPAGLKAVSDSTTWDFANVKAKTTSPLYSSSKEGILLTAETTPSITDEVIYADYDTTVLTIAAGFDAEAIAFTGEYPIRKDKYCMNGAVHFKTAVAGNIIVKFSDTGTSASATAVKRYLMVNGDSTQYWTSRENNGAEAPYAAQLNVVTEAIPVPAGDVVLTGSSAICVYYVTFIPDEPAPAPTDEPAAAPAEPTWPANQVKAVYSAKYEADCGFGEWGSGTVYTQEAFGKKYVTTGAGYFGLTFDGEGQHLNCSKMENLHLDVWIAQDTTIRVVPIWGGNEQGIFVRLEANKWNSIDIALADFDKVTSWMDVIQIKIDEARNMTFWLNNVYFYTTQAPEADSIAPQNFTAELAETSFFSVRIKAHATDNSGTVKYAVINGELTVGSTTGASDEDAYITVGNLAANTDYTFKVVAKDESGNMTDPIEIAAKTLATPAAAPAPDFAGKEAVAIFCDALENNPAIAIGQWGQSTVVELNQIAEGDNVYYCSNMNYLGWEFTPHINATGMEYVHVDFYASNMDSIKLTPISPAHEGSYTVNLTANQWTSVDVPLSAFEAANIDWSDIFQFKFMEAAPDKRDLFIDNVYFFKQAQAINNVDANASAQKYIRNGMLLIEKNGKVYTITGQVVR